MPDTPFSVLFLCTGNSARSILAEALMNYWGRGRFRAYSAGSHPAGRVNPLALTTLQQMGIPVGTPRSKSWDELCAVNGAAAVRLDLVITVCDNAASEICPVWPGQPLTAHWGVPDPASVEGSDADKRRAFRRAFEILHVRIRRLAELPVRKLGMEELRKSVREIGALTAGEVA